MMQSQMNPMAGLTAELGKKVKAARHEEERRLAIVDSIPASWQMADVHYRAVRYGALNKSVRATCPCCNQRIESQPFGFCDGTTDPEMGSQVVLFFSFVRTVIIYLVLHLLISAGYNLLTNSQGNACGGPGQLSCPKVFLTLLATANKHHHHNPLRTLDLLNLILVSVSIVYFILVRRYEYQRFNLIENEIQTEDDYTLEVEGIPVLLYSEQNKQMDYINAISQYFSGVVMEWLNSNRGGMNGDPIYQSYAQLAMNRYKHDPMNPPQIVANVDLCWNMTEMNNLMRHKEELKDKVENNMGKGFLSMSHNMYEQVQTSQRQGVANIINVNFRDSIDAVNEAYMDLSEKYDTDRTFDFCLSRFIGKAFVSFQYQQFASIVESKALSEGLQFHGSPLTIQKASDPNDINWQDLHMSPDEKANRSKNTFWITGGSLVFAFVSVLLINWLRNKWLLRMEEQGRTKASLFISVGTMVVVAIFVNFVNWLLNKFIWQLVGYEAHNSLTGQQRAYILKTLAAQFINTAISYVLVSFIMGRRLWDRSGLIMQVSVLFLFSTILQLITNIIYLPSVSRLWNLSYFSYGQPVPRFQDRFNKQYAMPQFHLSERFMYYLLQVYLVCFFSYIIPIGVPILLVAVVIHYYIDRINLFYRSSMTVHFNFSLLRTMYRLLEASVLVFAIGNAIWSKYFHVSFWRVFNVVALGVAVLFALIVYFLRYRWELKVLCTTIDFEPLSYSECQKVGKFEHTYKSENPATALLFYETKNFAYDMGQFGQQQQMGLGPMANPAIYPQQPVNMSGIQQSPPGSYVQGSLIR